MLDRYILPILVAIALGITGSAFYFAVNYGKQKAVTQCETEKAQNTKDAQSAALSTKERLDDARSEYESKTDDDLDSRARSLNIMRDPSDI
jgi:hypothetical protein